MREFPKGGIIGKTVNAVRTVQAMRIPLHAAYAGYFIILALFPALVLIMPLLSVVGIPVENLLALLGDYFPTALMETVETLVFSPALDPAGTVVGVSALAALWSASKGIFGLMRGLNAIYGVEEDRGYFHTRFISVIYTFLFLIVLVLTLSLHVFGNSLIGLLSMVNNGILIFLVDLINLRFWLLLILQSLVFTLMFMALPNRRNRFWESFPGGVLASGGWLVFSDLFSIYVENFSRYSNIFGSVYAVALSMLWLYCCMSILFYGGALNRYLMDLK